MQARYKDFQLKYTPSKRLRAAMSNSIAAL